MRWWTRRQLRSARAERRARAAARLADSSDPEAPSLLQELLRTDSAPFVRWAALDSLARLRPELEDRLLVDAVCDLSMQANAVSRLGDRPGLALAELTSRLGSLPPASREQIAEVISRRLAESIAGYWRPERVDAGMGALVRLAECHVGAPAAALRRAESYRPGTPEFAEAAKVRRVLVRAMGQMCREEHVVTLAALLTGDPDSEVREQAAAALGEIPCEASMAALRPVLFDPGTYDGVRKACEVALRTLGWEPASAGERVRLAILAFQFDDAVREGAPAVEPLIALLDHAEWHLRVRAAEALARIGDVRAVEPLQRLLDQESEWYARRQVRAALLQIGGPDRAELLVQSLGEIQDREAARDALLQMGTEAVPALLAGLRGSRGFDIEIVKLLGSLRDPRAVPSLVSSLRAGNLAFVPDALRAIGAPAVDPLLLVLQDTTLRAEIRCQAASCLGDIGDPRAVPALVEALRDDSSYTYTTHSGWYGDWVGDWYKEPDSATYHTVRLWEVALSALGRMTDPRAMGAIAAAAESDSDPQRAAASRELLARMPGRAR